MCLEHRGKQLLARLRLLLPGGPVRARLVEDGVAIAHALPLDRVAVELAIVAGALGIFRRKERPLLALCQRLQPFGAQPVGERCPGVPGEKRADAFRIGGVEFEPDLPIRHVLLEQMSFQTRRHTIQAGSVAGPISVARCDEIGIRGLRVR